MIEVHLNPSNIGEVLACLGLFELAELYGPSFGGFKETGEGKVKFVLETQIGFKELLEKLKQAKISPRSSRDPEKREYPVEVGLENGKMLTLNWWFNPLGEEKTLFKIWAGRKDLYSYLMEYQKKLVERQKEISRNPFYRIPLVSLGFDASGSWDRSTAGYSYDDADEEPYVSPLAEFLSTIALQSFRPKVLGKKLEYHLWEEKLPHSVARLAFVGGWIGKPSPITGPWKLEVKEKGQAYKRLTLAQRF